MIKHTGDTLIEVLLAVSVFAMLAVGAIMIMGQGNNAGQRALEQTLVKQEIDSQVQMLRAIQQNHFATPVAEVDDAWTKVIGPSTSVATSASGNECPAIGSDHFILNPRKAPLEILKTPKIQDITAATAPPYAQIQYETATPQNIDKAYGLWIERKAVDDSINKTTSYEFTVRACWFGPGSSVPMQLSSVVRLYGKAVVADTAPPATGGSGSPSGGSGTLGTTPTTPTTPTATFSITGATLAGCSGAGSFTDPGYAGLRHCNPPEPLYSCVDYAVNIRPNIDRDYFRYRSGTYRLVIKYRDKSDGCSSYADPPAGYSYRVVVTDRMGWRPLTVMRLPAGQTEYTSDTFELYGFFGRDEINLEWINNCWLNTQGQCIPDSEAASAYADPDLVYESITLEKVD